MNVTAPMLNLRYEHPVFRASDGAGGRVRRISPRRREGAKGPGTMPRALRPGRRPARYSPIAVAPLATALVILLAACGPRVPMPTRPAWESLPPGSPLRSHTLSDKDAWLRHYVMFGEMPEALGAFGEESPLDPRDDLLSALQEGLVLHEAGQYARSNDVLEWAEVEAELRYTRSVSREVASILVSDRVLAYTPPAGELAMVPYYRMLNYLALGERAGALVEARKATALLERLGRSPLEQCNGDGVVQYIAGLVQRAEGEINDALVSLRQAERAFAACEGSPGSAAATVASDLYRVASTAGLTEVADSMVSRYGLDPAGSDASSAREAGDLLVVVEHGFVAHRTQDALHIPIPDGDLDELDDDDDDGLARFAGEVSRSLLYAQSGDRVWRRRHRAYRGSAWGDALDGAYILRLAWPTYRLEANRPREVRVSVGGAAAQPVPVGNLSMVMREELASERPAMLARLVLRGLTKYLVSRELEEKTEKKHGEAAGFLIGTLANIAGNQLEQADTRSWTLLPDRVSLVRMRLPPGSYPLSVEVVGDAGGSRVRDLGEVVIEPGALTVVRERVWARDAEARWEEEFDRFELRLDAEDEVAPLAADSVP